ncbi:hypothetical protein Godav_025018, partial [Gossypium davidsonii]|nr:hypothetical protein [Gossypium davidsonii]
MKDDIDELKVLMDFIINYLFGSVIRDYNHFRLPAKNNVNPKFLLDAPFAWGDADNYCFLINLVYLIKRNVLDVKHITKFSISAK